MRPVYFCLIPYFEYYDGTEAPDVPECTNFLPVDIPGENNAECYELLFGALSAKKELPRTLAGTAAENDGIIKDDGVIEDATVVFCAKADSGALVTVGWYAHANVTLTPEYLPMTDEDGREILHPFFFCTHRQNAVLLPPDERFRPEWQIPRNKGHAKGKFGFSADPFWLCDEPTPAAVTWKTAFLEKVAAYTENGDNLLDDTPDGEEEPAT